MLARAEVHWCFFEQLSLSHIPTQIFVQSRLHFACCLDVFGKLCLPGIQRLLQQGVCPKHWFSADCLEGDVGAFRDYIEAVAL